MKALVTGGGGFLGEAITRALLKRGDSVRVLARGDYPALRDAGAELVRGDVVDDKIVTEAVKGVDVVFHTAAKAGGWGDPRDFEASNVTGTKNILSACESSGCALVYTSTPSVVHAHRDIEGDDERLPYATDFTAHYPRTKALAEQAVRANTKVRSISIRPHFIWGPGDRHLLPRLLVRARAGRLRQVGSRDVKTDTVYVDNCVHAHLLAASALLDGRVTGQRVYFVSDDAPIGTWTMANRMLAAAGAPQVGKPVPAWVAYGLGATLEAVHGAFGLKKEPLMTRFAASELSHAQWFDISAIKRDLGYAPIVTMEQGLERLATWCRDVKL